ncbi:MAG: hypothetical protein IT449_13035 [Phycisphaerales bacterium]|nr:hypothetical protein [Phycisphaerales bacterium]
MRTKSLIVVWKKAMVTTSGPLTKGEVGTFGELSARPNPLGLVVLQVPALEDLLPFLEAKLGRKLTDAELAEHNDRAPSMAVEAEVANHMQAFRRARR